MFRVNCACSKLCKRLVVHWYIGTWYPVLLKSLNATSCDPFFMASGLDYSRLQPPTKEELQMFPGLQKLTAREMEALLILGVTFPEKEARCIDLSESIARARLKDASPVTNT